MKTSIQRELNFVCKMLYSSNIEKSCVNQILKKISRMETSSGLEFTVKWLKACSQSFLRDTAGVSSTPDVSLDKNNILLRALRRAQARNHTFQLNILLSLHKNFVAQELTLSQVSKFCKAVTTPSFSDGGKLEAPRISSAIASNIQRSFSLSDVRTSVITEMCYRQPKFQPFNGKENWEDISKGKLRTLMLNSKKIPGTIMVSQEPGFKARFFAFASPPEMGYLRSLQTILLNTLKQIPQDCTFDQTRGAEQVVVWMEEGNSPCSVDLSNATDRFPAKTQHELLKSAVKLITSNPNHNPELLSNFTWYLSMVRGVEMKQYQFQFPNASDKAQFQRLRKEMTGRESKESFVSWEVGQPLGLPHSFPLFALAHHAVMEHLGITDYVILGDDVVTKSQSDAYKYMAFVVNNLGIDLSEQKSFAKAESKGRLNIAQFAGRTFYRKDRLDIQARPLVQTLLPISYHTWSRLNLKQRLERGLPGSLIKGKGLSNLKKIVLCTSPEVGTCYRTSISLPLDRRVHGKLTFDEILQDLLVVRQKQIPKSSLHSLANRISMQEKKRELQPALKRQIETIPTSTSVDWDRQVPDSKPVDMLVQVFRDPYLNRGVFEKALSRTYSLLEESLVCFSQPVGISQNLAVESELVPHEDEIDEWTR